MPRHPISIQRQKHSRLLSKVLYKDRARIEQAVGKLKRFKRIALRCEKTAQNYASFVALALASS
jgi:transposase